MPSSNEGEPYRDAVDKVLQSHNSENFCNCDGGNALSFNPDRTLGTCGWCGRTHVFKDGKRVMIEEYDPSMYRDD